MLLPALVTGWLLVLSIANACGDTAHLDSAASATSEPADPSALPSPTQATQSAAVGFLEGSVSIGPLRGGPVSVGAVPASPPPEACTSRGVVVRTSDTAVEVARVGFLPDCTYRVPLPAGTYQVDLPARGIERSADLPAVVTITPGQTTQLNLRIDTGIR